ncbi:MAG: gamma-glutamyl-gamma-aminobutyrate hydrolase family protein [Candidatus Marinimicrobia bacterium]|nr:gamma-glutamyl-gamma-aminobutyrate hydrolase family protein [Candidatus Neomarinimicrobiota bacterium]
MLFLLVLLSACSADKEPVIGVTMVYWQNHYSIHKTYADAIRENGGRLRLIPCSEDEKLLRRELAELDGIVFIGGRDYDPSW